MLTLVSALLLLLMESVDGMCELVQLCQKQTVNMHKELWAFTHFEPAIRPPET